MPTLTGDARRVISLSGSVSSRSGPHAIVTVSDDGNGFALFTCAAPIGDRLDGSPYVTIISNAYAGTAKVTAVSGSTFTTDQPFAASGAGGAWVVPVPGALTGMGLTVIDQVDLLVTWAAEPSHITLVAVEGGLTSGGPYDLVGKNAAPGDLGADFDELDTVATLPATFYFRARAVNGPTAGPWSAEVSGVATGV